MCEAFLKDEESYRAAADKLVQISHYYGFDGWLVNVENVLSVSRRRCAVSSAHITWLTAVFPNQGYIDPEWYLV